ncbi:MAG: hypothetical protein B7Z37_07690 [Verrucomicrobia bacterium 12-59-8]|nr:MAG: hypothetical protein B7Z37_07690 [Verrucomicrobia bacterium 12-59-8]
MALEFDAENYRRLDVPLEDESMDMVMSTQVIENIEDHEKAAAELCRVLKPGGYALITVPHPPESFPNDGRFREGYTESDLAALFAPHGLKPLHTDYFLIRRTTDRMVSASNLPAHGSIVPDAWVDAETHLNAEARRTDTPFSILMLSQKAAR